jgi:hypothetical protein
MSQPARVPKSGGSSPSLRLSFQCENLAVDPRDLETKTGKQFVNVDL